MMKIISALLLTALALQPAYAQNQTGARLRAGPGINIDALNSISTQLPVKDQSAGAYTILAADNAFLLGVGTGGATLPQAGSAGFPANWQICVVNLGLGDATISTTTSIFRGAGEATSLRLGAGGWACLQSNGGNWITLDHNGSPVITDPSQARTLGVFECEQNATINFTSTPAVAVALSATAPPGCSVDVIQNGAGQISFAPSGAGTLKSFDNYTKTAGQNAGVTLRVITNTGSNAAWFLFGRGAP